MLTRGQRNHNPFNLRFYPNIPWAGLAAPAEDDGGYCVFVPYADEGNIDYWGLRAGFRDLYVKWAQDNLRTIAEIVPKFAPPSENQTTIYEADVAKWTGWAVNAELTLGLPDDLLKFGKAFLRQEDGSVPYDDKHLLIAVTSALNRR